MRKLIISIIDDIFNLEQIKYNEYSNAETIFLQDELKELINEKKLLFYTVLNKLVLNEKLIDFLIEETKILFLKNFEFGFITFMKKSEYKKISNHLESSNTIYISFLKDGNANASKVIFPSEISLYKNNVRYLTKLEKLEKHKQKLFEWFHKFNKANNRTNGLNHVLLDAVLNDINIKTLIDLLDIIDTINTSEKEYFVILKFSHIESMRVLKENNLLKNNMFEEDNAKILVIE